MAYVFRKKKIVPSFVQRTYAISFSINNSIFYFLFQIYIYIDGRRLFREALEQGSMECYYPLAAQFTTQADPAYCGLGTLTMVLNALNIDPGRIWKGPWRWYSESMLDCCISLSIVQQQGISLDTFACLARCNGAAATIVRIPSSSKNSSIPNNYTVQPFILQKSSSLPIQEEEEGLQKFRQTIIEATHTKAGSFLVCAYNRQTLGQTGSGHYSPIGAYHKETDSVLIMDVARFKYPPHWVKVSALYEAMRCIDNDTGLSRGYVTIQRSASVPLVLFAFGLVTSPDLPINNNIVSHTHSSSTPIKTTTKQGASCGHASCATTSAPSTYTPPSVLNNTSVPEKVNNCRGQGRSVPGAGETLRKASITFNETYISINPSLSSTTNTTDIITKLGKESIKVALDSFLHIPISTTNKLSTNIITNTINNPLFPLHVINNETDSTNTSYCMTSLSKEQLSAAAALLTELEHTLVYSIVRQTLEEYTLPKKQQNHHSPVYPSSVANSLVTSSSSNTTLTDQHSILLTATHNHAGDDKQLINDIIPDNSSLKSTEIAGGTVVTLSNSNIPGSNETHSHSSECGHKAMTCVRVHTAHVVTMLLLTLYSSPASILNIKRQLNTTIALSTLPSKVTTAEILHYLVSQSLPSATPLVQAEVQLLRGQLELD